MSEFPHVLVAGGPAERGQQYGEQAKERVLRSVAAYAEVFEHYTGWDWTAVRHQAARFEAPIADFRPDYLAELRGIAEGAGLELLDVLAINVRTEIMFAAQARAAAGGHGPPGRPDGQAPAAPSADASPRTALPGECSAFAVAAPPGRPGPTLTGQNWDWLPHASDTVVVLEARQDDGPDFVTVVEAGLLAKTGMNSAGLGVVTNALVTADDTGAPGLPYHLMLRAILDSTTVSGALTALQEGFRSSSANYLITHESGVAVNVEAAPGDFSRLYFVFPDPGTGVLLHTNHFVADRFDRLDVSVWAMPSSPMRLQRLLAGVGAMPSPSLDAFRALLSDHADYPASICCHPDLGASPLDQAKTVTSVLMDLNARANVASRRQSLRDRLPAARLLDFPRRLKELAHAAGNVDRGAGDVAGPVAGEEGDQARHLLGLAEPAHRHLGRGHLAEELLSGDLGGPQLVDVLPLRGQHEPDVHAVDQDLIPAKIDGQRLGQAQARGPVHRRGQEHRIGVASVDRVDVDHPRGLAAAQVRQRRPGAPDLGEQLDLDVGLPVVVGQRAELAGVGPAGVVDQDVESAHRLVGRLDERGDLIGHGHVAHHRGDLTGSIGGFLADLVRGRFEFARVARADRDRHALGDQACGYRLTQPLRSAGDDRPAARQPELHLGFALRLPVGSGQVRLGQVEQALARRAEHVNLVTVPVGRPGSMRHPGRDHGDVALAHCPHVTVEVEFQFAVDDDHDLLF
jgi:isopenicillin-N N-acyltransferase like protein